MKRKHGWIVAVVIAASSIGAERVVSAESAPTEEAGRDLYQEHCAICHGPKGRGDGPLAAILTDTPSDLTEIAKRRGGDFPEVEIREIIDGRRKVRAHGPEDMPIWGRAFRTPSGGEASEAAIRAKISALVEYLRSIQASWPGAHG
ncbi:MAG TPA: cytochrome c [Myxococcota bacterium]|nr:cytochrome c [Myxococcota bacterium]